MLNLATTAAWSEGAGGWGLGSSVIDGNGVAATISTAGMLSGLTSRWEANVVDQLAAASVDPGVVGPFWWQEPVQIPHPVAVALVTGPKPRAWSKLDLGACWALDDLGGGGERLVVEVAEEDHRDGFAGSGAGAGLVALGRNDLVESGATGHGFGGPSVQGVAGIAEPLTLVVGSEGGAGDPAGLAIVGDQFRLQVAGHHRDPLASRAHGGGQRTPARQRHLGLVLGGGRVVERQVTGLDRENTSRERLGVGPIRQAPGRQQRHPDATAIGDAEQSVVEVDAARGVQVGEHLLWSDLLQRHHVRLNGIDHRGEGGELGL